MATVRLGDNGREYGDSLVLMVPPFANPPDFLTEIPSNYDQIMPIEFFFWIRFIELALECLAGIVNADVSKLTSVLSTEAFGETQNILF